MADFLLDFRPRAQRGNPPSELVWLDGIESDSIERDEFALYLTRTGQAELWEPFVSEQAGVVIAVCGQLVLDPEDWSAAESVPGPGGLAAKAIYTRLNAGGVDSLPLPNGCAVVHVYEPRAGRYTLLTDVCGAFPCWAWEPSGRPAIYASHPDVLAKAAGIDGEWDRVSLTEFLVTGRVSFPFSYYREIRALPSAARHGLGGAGARRTLIDRALTDFSLEPDDHLDNLADELAGAIQNSVRRRTQPRLGRSVLALSGGLDSRSILCCTPESSLATLCTFDEENAELDIARRIASAHGSHLEPLRRDFDHYGSAAELGVRMSGGMGDFGSNHFLGFRARLLELGFQNLVTGCYFDYLFKSLAIDKAVSPVLRRESLAEFGWQTYLPHFSYSTNLAEAVRDRLESSLPESLRTEGTPEARLRIATTRTFPLHMEGDNMQRLVTQRMMGWYAPALDRDVVEVYRRTPPNLRLNRSLFKAVVRRLCPPAVRRIPDANTGLPVRAPAWIEAALRYKLVLRRRLERRRRSIVSQDSWPNWVHYLRTSSVVDGLWRRPNPAADEFFVEATGSPRATRFEPHSDRDCRAAMRQLTVKLWLDQRLAPDTE